MKIMVTGGAGFIGSNFVRYMLARYPSYKIINLDKLTYAGNLENLAGCEEAPGYRFIKGDICNRRLVGEILAEGIDAIVNFAAESHVDRSIDDSSPFVRSNIEGTRVLLEAARKRGIGSFIQISTDEVYGSITDGPPADEEAPLRPSNPYSASKAGADLLVRSFHLTHKLPCVITRCTNNYGPYQFPEKFVPLAITNSMEDIPIPIYGDGLDMRDWIHVGDHVTALDAVIHHGKAGQIYNIATGRLITNLDVARMIVKELNKPESLLTFVKDRPAHDRVYSVDPKKMEKEMGWRSKILFHEGLKCTIKWYNALNLTRKRVYVYG